MASEQFHITKVILAGTIVDTLVQTMGKAMYPRVRVTGDARYSLDVYRSPMLSNNGVEAVHVNGVPGDIGPSGVVVPVARLRNSPVVTNAGARIVNSAVGELGERQLVLGTMDFAMDLEDGEYVISINNDDPGGEPLEMVVSWYEQQE